MIPRALTHWALFLFSLPGSQFFAELRVSVLSLHSLVMIEFASSLFVHLPPTLHLPFPLPLSITAKGLGFIAISIWLRNGEFSPRHFFLSINLSSVSLTLLRKKYVFECQECHTPVTLRLCHSVWCADEKWSMTSTEIESNSLEIFRGIWQSSFMFI